MFAELNQNSQSNHDTWRIDASAFSYINISNLEFDKVYMVCGAYMYNGSSNNTIKAHGILSIMDLDTGIGNRVNLPVRYNYLVKQLSSIPKYQKGINDERCGVTFEKATTKSGNVCYNVKLTDL